MLTGRSSFNSSKHSFFQLIDGLNRLNNLKFMKSLVNQGLSIILFYFHSSYNDLIHYLPYSMTKTSIFQERLPFRLVSLPLFFFPLRHQRRPVEIDNPNLRKRAKVIRSSGCAARFRTALCDIITGQKSGKTRANVDKCDQKRRPTRHGIQP